jgi:hypothetical protein
MRRVVDRVARRERQRARGVASRGARRSGGGSGRAARPQLLRDRELQIPLVTDTLYLGDHLV